RWASDIPVSRRDADPWAAADIGVLSQRNRALRLVNGKRLLDLRVVILEINLPVETLLLLVSPDHAKAHKALVQNAGIRISQPFILTVATRRLAPVFANILEGEIIPGRGVWRDQD